MLSTPEKILFACFVVLSLYFTVLGFRRVVRVISRGHKGFYPRFNHLPWRIAGGLARAFTQVTVFRARPWVSFLHSFIFYGFTFYILVNLVDLIYGYLPEHYAWKLHFGLVGDIYNLIADILSVLVLIGMVYFLVRRFITGDKRLTFNTDTPLLDKVRAGGMRRDSLIVGGFIFFHVGFHLLGAAGLISAAGFTDPWQPFASLIASGLGFGVSQLLFWHIGWWGALGLILAFLPYFPRSKHLHLFAAPAKLGFEPRQDGKLVSSGALEPIDFEDEAAEQYGAARLEHLGAAQLLDAYACIQCNRCTNVCPAQTTGKALSPGALEINKRYELNTIAEGFAEGGESPPVLDFMLDEASLWACTTCGACMEVCPVGCEQMIDIVDIRRNQVLMEGTFPQDLSAAFRGMERNGNPWGIAQEKREEWAEGLGIPTVTDNSDFEVLYWVGCAGAYDPSAQKTARAMAEILAHAKVNYAILGKAEKCTGDPARRAGNEYLYYGLATENVAILNEVLVNEKLDSSKPKRIVASCTHCFNALLNDYPQLGGDYSVVHHTQLIDELMNAGRLPPMDISGEVTYHDPCYLGRHNGIYEAPRDVLEQSGLTLKEMPRNRNNSFCCGAGGAQFWKEEEPGRVRVSENRFQEAVATGAAKVAVACPFCKAMLASSKSAQAESAPEVIDVAQLVADNLRRIAERLQRSAS